MALGAEVATLVSRRPFTRLSTLVTGAFGGILLWMVGISVAGLFGGGLPLGLGWLGVGMVVLLIALIG